MNGMITSLKYSKADVGSVNLLLFLCVFITDAMSLPLPQVVKVLLSTLICIWVVLVYGPHSELCRNYSWLYVICPCFLLLFSQIIHLDFVLSYECKILQIMAGYVLFRKIPFDLFVEKYLKLMYFICLFSIPIWFAHHIGWDIWSWAPSSGDGQYKTLFFYAVDVYSISGRNNGPFWEPGVFQIYINIAVMFLLFLKEHFSVKYLVVFTVVLITTYSTTGYLCFAMLLITYVYNRGKKIKAIHLILLLAFFIAAYLYITTNEELYLKVFGKLEANSESSKSAIIRSNEILFYFQLWISTIHNFLFGAGASSAYEQVSILHSVSEATFEGSTQTTFRELASFGLLFTLIKMVLYYRFCALFTSKVMGRLALFVVMFIMMNTESLVYSMMFNSLFYLDQSKRSLM